MREPRSHFGSTHGSGLGLQVKRIWQKMHEFWKVATCSTYRYVCHVSEQSRQSQDTDMKHRAVVNIDAHLVGWPAVFDSTWHFLSFHRTGFENCTVREGAGSLDSCLTMFGTAEPGPGKSTPRKIRMFHKYRCMFHFESSHPMPNRASEIEDLNERSHIGTDRSRIWGREPVREAASGVLRECGNHACLTGYQVVRAV